MTKAWPAGVPGRWGAARSIVKRMKVVMKKLDETGGKPADMKDPFSQQVIREEIVEEVLVPIKRAAPADPAAPSWAAHGPTLPDAEQKDAYDKSHLRCWKFRNHPMVVRALSRWWGVNENSFDDLDGDGVMDLTCDQYLSILHAKSFISVRLQR